MKRVKSSPTPLNAYTTKSETIIPKLRYYGLRRNGSRQIRGDYLLPHILEIDVCHPKRIRGVALREYCRRVNSPHPLLTEEAPVTGGTPFEALCSNKIF